MSSTKDRGVQFHLSPLLAGSIIAGIATTIAVVGFAVLTHHSPGPPPIGVPPPPEPDPTGLIISIGLWVIAWVAVLVTIARDQVLRRLSATEQGVLDRLEEYGERRETDGYLNGLRSATGPPGDVRTLRPVPPPAGGE